MNTAGKVIATGAAGLGAFFNAADANAQTKIPTKPNHGETAKVVHVNAEELAELTGRPVQNDLFADLKKSTAAPVQNDLFRDLEKAKGVRLVANNSKTGNVARPILTSRKSTAELAARTRINSVNENKITTKDTPLAPTVEAIASEVAEYGLLQTRKEKLDFAKKLQLDVDDNVRKGLKNAGKEGQSFLKAVQWLESPKRDSIFDSKNGYTKERLITALVNSPDFGEAYGSLVALARKEYDVPFVTNFNEKLLRESKLVMRTESKPEDLVSIRR